MTREGIRVILTVIGLLLILAGTIYSCDSSVKKTIAKSRIIESHFNAAHAFIAQWRAEHARLPTASEFDSWAGSGPKQVYGRQNLNLVTSGFPEEVIELFGSPPDGAYLLEYWRGEWFEYGPSWSEKNSLIFDKSRFHLSGSAKIDSLIPISIGTALLIIAWRFGRRAA